MIIRRLRIEDCSRIYDLFSSAAVRRENSEMRTSGFYEYDLSIDDFRARLDNPEFSLALEDEDIVAYLLGYRTSHVGNLDFHGDLVLPELPRDFKVVYADQLFMQGGFPAFIVGRLADTWTTLIQNHGVREVVTAIPQKPWKNQDSTRFAIDRGFRRTGRIQGNDLELGVFRKPLIPISS